MIAFCARLFSRAISNNLICLNRYPPLPPPVNREGHFCANFIVRCSELRFGKKHSDKLFINITFA